MTKSATFDKPFEIRFHESDHAGRLTPVALFNYLQETAMAHSTSRGRSPKAVAAKGLAWFMVRLHMRIERYPEWNDVATVRTWAHNLRGLYAVREFSVTDGAGAPVARATTRWVVIDAARRRPTRIPAWITEAYPALEERAVQDAFEDLPSPETEPHARTFHVRLSDLDANRHANSSCYVDWFLEAPPHEITDAHLPTSIEIAYKREATLGESLVATAAADPSFTGADPRFLHRLYRESDRTLLALGRSSWRRAD